MSHSSRCFCSPLLLLLLLISWIQNSEARNPTDSDSPPPPPPPPPSGLLGRLVAANQDDKAPRHGPAAATTTTPTSPRQVWDYRRCQHLAVLMQKKSTAIRKIESRIRDLEPDDHRPASPSHSSSATAEDSNPHRIPMRHLQADALRILVQELDETESMIWTSIRWLDEVLSGGDYSSVLSLTGNAWKRLDALRHATLREEEEYMALVKAEENLLKANHTHVKGVIDDFLHEVSDVADDLEAKVDEHIFKDIVHQNESVHMGGLEIETVIRVPYDRHVRSHPSGSRKIRALPVRLIDSNENQFILSKGKDATMPQDDRHLIQDLVLLWSVATVGGWICSALNIPSLLGYVFGGMILGPAVTGSIQCIVQVETLAEFGIFFILFAGGLEFSATAVKKVIKVALTSMLFTTAFLSLLGLILGLPWNVSVNECVFVASCLSLSSSSLVFRFLDPTNNAPENDIPEIQTDCRSVLLGILVIQKVFMGVLMALLPNMAESSTASMELAYSFLYVVTVIVFFFVFLCVLSSQREVRRISQLTKHCHQELIIVTLASFLYVFMLVTEYLNVSMELGCFFAGLLISLHSSTLAEEVSEVVRPVRDLFGCLFFAAIGLHIYPQFLAQELFAVVILTTATVFAKYVLYFVSLTFVVHPSSSCVRWLVPSALSQVSECSFVLGSRARKLGLISREVYLLILGVTSLSFLFAPVLWHFSLSGIRKRLLLNVAHTL